MAVFDRWFELDFLGDLDRAVCESIRQSGNDMDVCYSTCRSKDSPKNDSTFNPMFPRVFSVLGLGFSQNPRFLIDFFS